MKLQHGLLFGLLMTMNLSLAFSAQAQRGENKQPPKEAIEACSDKSEGDEVTFETPRGDEVKGICMTMDEQLVAVPENHKKKR